MRAIEQKQYIFNVGEVSEALADWVLKKTGEKIENGKPLVSNLQVNPAEGFLIWTVFPYEPEAPKGSTIQ